MLSNDFGVERDILAICLTELKMGCCVGNVMVAEYDDGGVCCIS